MAEQVVEAEWREESCVGASTPVEVHSTDVVARHASEMNEQWVEHGIEVDKTTEEVQTRKDEQGDPEKACERIGWGYDKLGMSLASPAGKVWCYALNLQNNIQIQNMQRKDTQNTE